MTITVSGGFIGRSRELGRLLAAMERAEQGQPAMVLLAGDAGVGKTRLLVELAGRARERGVQVLIGGCLELGDVGLPYLPIVAALRGFATEAGNDEMLVRAAKGLAGLGSLLPELADQPTTPVSLDKGLEQLQLFDAVGSLLVRLSEHAPVVLILEDLHWADSSTRELAAFLHQTLRGGRVLLVASYRSDELHRSHQLRPWLAELIRRSGVEHLELAPFNRSELAERLAAIRGTRLPTAAVERIFSRSQGSPFYAEELLAAGADEADIRLPSTLADLLLVRVETLSQPAQWLLRVITVAGRVSHRMLVDATGWSDPELEDSLREAITARILVVDADSDTYAFRHALLQEAVYGDLLPGERTRLHATYARLLTASGPAAELAYHCLAGHDLPAALAALIRAAAQAAAVSAPAERYRHLTQALELWDRVPNAAAVATVDRVDLLLRAAEAANQSGQFQRAVGLTREAVAAIDPSADPLRAALAHERLGHYVLEAEVELGWEQVEVQMLAACRRAVELVPAQPPTALRARVAIGLARALAVTGAPDEARRWAEEALAVARAAGSTVDETHALATLGSLELQCGNVEAARSLVRDARRRAAVTGDRPLELRAQCNLGVLELDVGNLAVACTTLDEAAELAERSGLAWSSYGLDAQVLGGIAHYAAGQWDRAERVAVAVDDRHPGAGLLSAVALFVAVGRGRANAEERLARLAPLREADPFADYLAGGCEADLALWQGDLDRARTLVRQTLSEVDRIGEVRALSAIWPAALGLAAEADRAERARVASDEPGMGEARALGRELLDRARAAARRAREFGSQVGPEALAWLARAEAEWTRLEGHSDPEAWRAAVDAFSYGYVYEVARCQRRLAEALLGVGDREQATPMARDALQTAERLGAEPLKGALQRLARRGRLALGVTMPIETRRAGLTPRELEVLRLLVEGRSNRQIAEQLFISGSTAGVHVTNILAKLGVHSRLEAAARARQLGLDHR
jgi:DNA-binding NarL/FixJ family response regulator